MEPIKKRIEEAQQRVNELKEKLAAKTLNTIDYVHVEGMLSQVLEAVLLELQQEEAAEATTASEKVDILTTKALSYLPSFFDKREGSVIHGLIKEAIIYALEDKQEHQ
jgi:hypothetical protein